MRCIFEMRKIEIKLKKKKLRSQSLVLSNNFCLKRRVCAEFQAALGIGGVWLAFTKGDVHLVCGGQLPMSVGPTGQGVAGGQEAPPPQFPTVLTGAPGYPSGTSSLSAKRLFFGSIRKVYAPWFLVSSQQRFGVMDIKAPSAGHSSRVLNRPYSSQVLNGLCYSS